eukprot:2572106-Rhodomonas_salina.2
MESQTCPPPNCEFTPPVNWETLGLSLGNPRYHTTTTSDVAPSTVLVPAGIRISTYPVPGNVGTPELGDEGKKRGLPGTQVFLGFGRRTRKRRRLASQLGSYRR